MVCKAEAGTPRIIVSRNRLTNAEYSCEPILRATVWTMAMPRPPAKVAMTIQPLWRTKADLLLALIYFREANGGI